MFTPAMSVQRTVQPLGDTTARIAIIGDVSDSFDKRSLRPFSGPPGSVLESCLHAAGLIRGECYITNMVKDSGTESDYVVEKQKRLTDFGKAAADDLRKELDQCEANVIVACGNMAFYALTGVWGVSQYRGYIFQSQGLKERRKVIPIFHPKDAIWGTYTRRHLISTDLKKAKLQSKTRDLVRPVRQLIYKYENVGEALEWLDYYAQQDRVAADIEVINYAISCVSFSSDPSIACVIPIAAGWTEGEELQLWRAMQKIFGSASITKVFQNGIFDMQFMLTQNGIVVRGPIEDTMLAHSVMYPEMQKGLGFLGSIYCGAQGYWKDKVKFNNIKEDS